jgi:hypothetical protein
MLTSFRGDRSCKTASPLSSKASAAGKGGSAARAAERQGGGLNTRHLLPSAWEPLAPPRGPEGGCRSRLCAGAAPSTPTSTHSTKEVRDAEEGRDIALTLSWARQGKSIWRRQSSIRRLRRSIRRPSVVDLLPKARPPPAGERDLPRSFSLSAFPLHQGEGTGKRASFPSLPPRPSGEPLRPLIEQPRPAEEQI